MCSSDLFWLLTDVFNATDTAPLATALLADAGTFDLGPKAGRIENPADWTREGILAKGLSHDKGREGNFDD